MSLLNALTGGLGYASDVAEKFGGRAIRGALGGKPRELLSPIPFSDSLGITDPNDRTSGSDLAQKFGIVGDNDPLAKGALGMGIDIATDPLTYLGGLGAARHVAHAAEPAAEAVSKFSALRKLREPFAMVKDLGGDAERVIGGGERGPLFLRQMEQVANKSVPDYEGLSISPWNSLMEKRGINNAGFARSGASPTTSTHEISHGITKNAVLQGGEENLPFMQRGAVKMYRSGMKDLEGTGNEMNLKTGIGNLLDEANAHTNEYRGLSDKLKGFGEFALSPMKHRLYDEQFSAHDPLAAALYHASPGAVVGGIGGGAAGAEEGGRRDGLEGALAGGLGGALLGGLGGAAVSHSLYSPSLLNRSFGLPEEIAAESARVGRNPVDLAKRAAMDSPEARSAAPRRYSEDPARAAFYKDWRTTRYSDRMRNPGAERDPASLIDQLLSRKYGT